MSVRRALVSIVMAGLWLWGIARPGQAGAAMFRGGPRRTGAFERGRRLLPGGLAWRYDADAESFRRLAIDLGMVYVASKDGTVYGLDLKTGVEKWSFLSGSAVASDLAAVDGLVYFSSQGGHFCALDVRTGELKWAFDTQGPMPGHPAVAEGMVFCWSHNGNLNALDAKTG